jgi:hypothetical protein
MNIHRVSLFWGFTKLELTTGRWICMLKTFLGAAIDKASESLAAAKDVAAESLESTRASVVSAYDSTANQANDFIAAHWPMAQQMVVNSLLTITEDHLNDPKTLTSAFETAHAAMPLPIRLVIRQDTFVAFCFAQRDSLSEKVLEYKATSIDTHLLLCAEQSSDTQQDWF